MKQCPQYSKFPGNLRPFDLWQETSPEFETGEEEFDAYLKFLDQWLQDQGITDRKEFYLHVIAYLEGGYDDEEECERIEDATSTETS